MKDEGATERKSGGGGRTRRLNVRDRTGLASAMTAVEIAVIVLVVAILAVGVAVVYLGHYLPKKRVAQALRDLGAIRSAIQTSFVDGLHGEVHPLRGNAIPTILTTPVAYLQTIPRDPFAPKPEGYRYVPQSTPGWPHYLVASRGPDGDWDLDRLPDRIKIHEGRWLSNQEGVQVPGYFHEARPNSPYNLHWYGMVEYYITADGRRVEIPQYEIAVLPQGLKTAPDMVKYLAENNIAVYDPTNGLKSNGDLIRFSDQ